jgi:hypothetical protein
LASVENSNSHGNVGLRRTLVIGAGGSGVLAATHFKALQIARYGAVRPGTRLLGFDVMETPSAVSVPQMQSANGATPQTRLEPGMEFVQIGRDCDPTRLSHVARQGRDINPELRELIALQPDGRFTKSLQTGTEGERLYGNLAFTWSLGEVRRTLQTTLRALNDVRLPAESAAHTSAGLSLQVLVLTSLAGGVGSSIALPLARETKRAMDRLGMDVNQSTFVGVCFTPDCFPETVLRFSNAAETIRDINLSQKEAMIP